MVLGRTLDHLPSPVAVPVRARWGDRDPEVGSLHRYVTAGDTVLDVGAHKGAYTWHLARLVGPQGRVHAYEPQPLLATRLARWAPAHVTVHAAGVSDTPGVATLRTPVWGTTVMRGHASLESSRPDGDDDRRDDVPTVVLDDAGHAPTFIKADIEGHEAAMLRGAERTVAQHRPVLLLEVDYRHEHEVEQRRELVRWLAEHRYEAHAVDDAGAVRPVGTLPVDDDPNTDLSITRYVYNWFMVPR